MTDDPVTAVCAWCGDEHPIPEPKLFAHGRKNQNVTQVVRFYCPTHDRALFYVGPIVPVRQAYQT